MAIDFTAVFRAIADFSSVDKAGKKTSDTLKGMGESAEQSSKKTGTFGDKFTSSMDKVSKKSGQVGKDLSLGITAPVALIGTKAVQSFANFEQAIVAAGAKSGATKGEIEKMKDVALEMGATTKFSAGEAATAMDTMAASGFNANDVMKAIPGVMLAAQAAGEDLGLTADVTAKAINAFGLKAEDATHVADVFASAGNNSALSMQGLSDSLAHAGELGAKAGQGLEDVVSMISRLVDQGVPAASAGTAVRQAISSLLAPTKKSQRYIAALGLSFRDAEGNIKPIPDILDELTRGLDLNSPALQEAAKKADVTAQEYRDYALAAMFGVEGGKAIQLSLSKGKPLLLDAAKDTEKLSQLTAGLAKTMGKDAAEAWVKARTENGKFVASGADAVRAMSAMAKASDGTSKKIGDIMADTTAARIDQLGGSFETLAIRLITVMAPALTDIVSKVTNAVNSFAGFAQAHPEMAKMIVIAVLLAAAVGPLLIVFGKMAAGLGAIVKIAPTVGKAFLGIGKGIAYIGKAMLIAGRALLTNPIFLVITLLAVAGFLIYKNWDKVKAFLIAAWQAIGSVATKVWGAISTFFVGLWDKVIAAWQVTWSAVTGFFTTIWNAIVAAAKAIWGVLVTAVMTPVNLIVASVKAVLGTLYSWWQGFWGLFGGLIKAVWDLIVSIVKLGIMAVRVTVENVLKGLLVVWKSLWGTFSSAVSAVWKVITGVLGKAWSAIKTAAVTVWKAITKSITDQVTAGKNVLASIWNAIKSAAVSVWNAIKSAAASAWKGIQAVIIAPIRALWGLLSGPLATARSGLQGVWNAVKAAAVAAWNGLVSFISSAMSRVSQIASGIKNAVVRAVSGAGSWLYNAGKQIVQGLIDGVTAMVGRLTSTIDSVTSKISKFLPGSPVKEGPLKVLNRGYAGGQITKMLADGMDKGSGRLLKTFSGIVDSVPKQLTAEMRYGAKQGALTAGAPKAALARMAAHQAPVTRPLQVAAARTTPVKTAQPATGDGRQVAVHLTVNNPVGETTAETTTRQMSRLAALGII